ncbi:MAG TPA: hypothetical protein VMU50_07110 [Polyangia bacterium]|nr:hypothetical protein [Polyangia bacterium]
MRSLTRAVCALATAQLAVASGCAGSSQNEPATPPTFSAIYAEVFVLGTKGQCNYCHDRPANEISNGKLDMGHTQAAAFAAIVGVASASAKCGGGRQLVVPGDPENSLFYLKLGPAHPCGDRMPQGATPLTDGQLEAVRSWIASGAKND